jgi:hypothetical protein
MADSILLAAWRKIAMPSFEDRWKQHHTDLSAVMNALIDRRRQIVAKAMADIQDNKVPPTLATELSEVQNGINSVALALRQEEMFSVMCKSWDYLLVPPKTICEDIKD